jgi:hypothetical protein
MRSTSETGHAKNVANFETMIAFCIGYGITYNPTNNNLLIINLQQKFDKASQKLQIVKETKEPFDSVTGSRQLLFQPLKPLTTRLINSLIVQGAPLTVVKDARTIVRKITGKRAVIKNGKPEDNTISVSQQSYDRLADSFEQLIVLAQTETSYNPNEEDLKIAAMQAYQTSLGSINTQVRNAMVPYSNAIIARDEELYNPKTGLVETAMDVKKYVKSVFGASSPQYRQISNIVFKKPAA